ncbi:MAG: hypothetical protein KIPDCIKN_00292 [Haliscomenobacter sp.]|nr:hypothetical protein [Haliscomenobacter sp.]
MKKTPKTRIRWGWTALFVLLLSGSVQAQAPKPEDVFGFRVGADYKLADYDQMLAYYAKLDAASDRVQMTEIGKSVHGRPMKLLFISSEKNLKQLARFREISGKLARARIPEEEARKLAREGKAIVWFDGGMHATERAPAQMMPELAYRVAMEESAEMQKIRDQVITLIVPVINPDGVDIVVPWYLKYLGTPFETTSPPILYQEYVGHDNNRDWFMSNMPETKAVNQVLYQEWYPQIIHNHHQTSPAWARIFLPPFRSPVNPNIHPGVTSAVNLVGSAMSNRFAMLRMPGAISTTNFSMWWNGGMRTAPYFHNMIGILTETAHATPTPRYYDPAKKPATVAGLRTDGSEVFYPYPWEGGESHFRDAIDYTLEASLAVLNVAADRRETMLFDFYRMGRDAITNTKQAFAYIIPKDQWDASEARNLTEILQRGGLEAHEATAPFQANGKTYPAGSVLFYGAQAFRPYLIDLMEKQNHPNQVAYPGGPPVPPYDLAGWTLPMQMGVRVDRIDSAFAASTRELKDLIPITPGQLSGKGKAGFAFSCQENAAYRVVNELLRGGFPVDILQDSNLNVGGKVMAPGAFWVAAQDGLESRLEKLAAETGVSFSGLDQRPGSQVKPLRKVKVGLYKSWMANMDEGWTRWVLEQHRFDFDTLHDIDIRNKDLTLYSAIILPSQSPNGILHGHAPGTMPDEFTGGIEIEGAARLADYVRNGGTLITFDAASDLAIELLGLPVRNVTEGLSSQQFFIPGSLVRANVNPKHPLGFGMQTEVAAFYDDSRAFEVFKRSYSGEGGEEKIARAPEPIADVVVEYGSKDLLMSGWANGADRYLRSKAALVQTPYGKGKVVLFGFRPQFRGQPRGTYKLIFNAIFQGGN